MGIVLSLTPLSGGVARSPLGAGWVSVVDLGEVGRARKLGLRWRVRGGAARGFAGDSEVVQNLAYGVWLCDRGQDLHPPIALRAATKVFKAVAIVGGHTHIRVHIETGHLRESLAHDRGLGILASTSQAQYATASARTRRNQALHGGIGQKVEGQLLVLVIPRELPQVAGTWRLEAGGWKMQTEHPRSPA